MGENWAGFAVIRFSNPVPQQLNFGRPQNAYRGSLMVIYNNVFDVMLHLDAEWP